MDHDEVRERLEVAAAEPGGLDRLMAGDTATAQAVAAHVAGCHACTDELTRLRQVSLVLQRSLGTMAPADLRERTLAYVHEVGRPRGDVATPAAAPSLVSTPGRRFGGPALAWAAAIAAAVILSVAASTLFVRAELDPRLAAQSSAIEGLQEVSLSTLALSGRPDSARVDLTSPAGQPPASGTVLYSSRTNDLVVVATGLANPGPGREYRCWIESNGQRSSVGKMFFADDLAYWVGPAPAAAGLAPGGRFGVSLVDPASGGSGSQPVLLGSGQAT
ncbi:MAG: anti-sigma factor domain-containing protein [Chloroflexota bacterium]